MSDAQLYRTALHEAGHAYAAWRLGRGAGPVTVEPGNSWAGLTVLRLTPLRQTELDQVDVDRPFPLWPAAVRRKIEQRALVAAAGEAAENTLDLPAGAMRRPEPLVEQVRQLAAEPTRAEAEYFAVARADQQTPSDAEQLWKLMRAAYGDDTATGTAWLAYMAAEARAAVLAGAVRVHRLAGVLAEHGSLSGKAVRGILRGER